MQEKPPELAALEAEARRPLEELAKRPPGVTPFDPGSVAAEVGDIAGDMLDTLSQPDERESDDLSDAEGQALYYFLELEHLSRVMEVPDAASDDTARQVKIYETMLALHVSLPFNEAERSWLERLFYQFIGEASEADRPTLPRFIEQREDRIMMAGLRRVVSGRDLIRRWSMWYGEAGEYTGQGAVDTTRDALARLVALVQPDQPLPESYRKRRGLPDEKAQRSTG